MGASCAHLGCCGPRQEELVRDPKNREEAGEARSVAAKDDEDNAAFQLVKSKFKPEAVERRRSKSVPPDMTVLSKTEAEEAPEEEQLLRKDVEEGPFLHHARDDPSEHPEHPPLIYCMVQGCAEARGRMIWARVPEPTHCCCNTCSECCSLWNNERKWSSMVHYPVGRLPGYARDCKSLEVPDDLQENQVCEWDLPAWEAPQREVPSDRD